MSIKETTIESPVVAIAQKGNFNDGNPEFAKRHQPLLTELGERGVTAVVLNGAKDRSGNGDFSRYFTPAAGRLTAHDEILAVDAAYDLTGRVGLKEGARGKWVHFRPDAIPSSVTETAAAAAKSLRQEAGAVDSHLAIDLTPNGERLIEANGRNIGTMRPDPERPAAQRVHEAVTDALADKLTDMAIRKRKGVL